MSSKNPAETSDDHEKPENFISSQYKDIMVKVDEDIYYLDRLLLALQSKYFETLFIEEYADKNCEVIEIPIMDTDTFSAIVDIMYGKELRATINCDNCVSLLMAMDYLQMKIYLEDYKSFLRKLLYWRSPLNMEVFKLYHFIAGNVHYECLFPIVFEHLSANLGTLIDLDEFLPISFDHFFKIILVRDYESHMERTLCELCAKWIFHDLKNRLAHSASLVNAIKYRLQLPFDIDPENLSIPLPTINENLNEDTVSRYLYKLLEYNGQICSTGIGIPEQETFWDKKESGGNYQPTDDYISISFYLFLFQPKLKTFLKGGHFCDIVVKVGEKTFKLHRFVLKLMSGYFEEIFSTEYTELLAKCEGIPALPSMEKEYCLNEIDPTTFDIIIDHMYSNGNTYDTPISADVIVPLFKAAHMLRLNFLHRYEYWMIENSGDMSASEVIEILNFTHENDEYKNLNRVYLSKYIVDSWPEIGNLPQFSDLFEAITVPEETSDCSGENEVHLFNNVDQETFQLIINHIYLDKLDLTQDNIVRVLKASEIFKMKQLMEKCMVWLKELSKPAEFNSKDLNEVLRFIVRNTTRNDSFMIYFLKHIIQWPEIDTSLFCSFPYKTLENMLMSSDLYFDDPYKILDICSKWIAHDMENRYKLMPQIALAISRNGLVDSDEYNAESPPDLTNCSQDFVKGKLLEILSTTCIIPSAISRDHESKFKGELPIFITLKEDRTFSILNSNFDEIISLHICKYIEVFPYEMSATMINDNLFLICSADEKSFFHVYNFSLKRPFSLALDSRIDTSIQRSRFSSTKLYSLLNCCNEIYCCIEDGKVFKYSFELNRWRLFCVADSDKDELRFTSDGNILYRMYKISQNEDEGFTSYIMEAYNVEQNSWISLPNVPVLNRFHNLGSRSDTDDAKYKLTFMNDFGFAVLFKKVLYLLDQDAGEWLTMPPLPNGNAYMRSRYRYSIITQGKSGEMLYMLNNELHRFSHSDHGWQLKKDLPLVKSRKIFFSSDLVPPYRNIISIHKPKYH